MRSSLAVCLGGCGPALLRSKHRNLGRRRRSGKAQAVTDDFERRSVSFYPMTGGAGVERAMLGSQRKRWGDTVDVRMACVSVSAAGYTQSHLERARFLLCKAPGGQEQLFLKERHKVSHHL